MAVRPGETIEFKVSCEAGEWARVQILRPSGRRPAEGPGQGPARGGWRQWRYPGRRQPIRAPAHCTAGPAPDRLESFIPGANIWPTTRRRQEQSCRPPPAMPARLASGCRRRSACTQSARHGAARPAVVRGRGALRRRHRPRGGDSDALSFARDDSAGRGQWPCPSRPAADSSRSAAKANGKTRPRPSISPAAWWGNGISQGISAAPASSIIGQRCMARRQPADPRHDRCGLNGRPSIGTSGLIPRRHSFHTDDLLRLPPAD